MKRKRNQVARKQPSATNLRNLRTLLLLNVFAPEEIGARIAQAREEAGLTQPDLADLIGKSTRQVQNYESGASKPYKVITAISEATGHSVEWLLHGDEARDPPQLETLAVQVAATRADVARLLELVESLGADRPRGTRGSRPASGGKGRGR